MQAHPSVVYRQELEPLRIMCVECEHSEFIHGDVDERRCLYSECGCSGYTGDGVAA